MSRQPRAVLAKGVLAPGFDLGTCCCYRPGFCFTPHISCEADKQVRGPGHFFMVVYLNLFFAPPPSLCFGLCYICNALY
jgi:hypothetical protein